MDKTLFYWLEIVTKYLLRSLKIVWVGKPHAVVMTPAGAWTGGNPLMGGIGIKPYLI